MCRYAFSGPYKQHFACFACRKAFKQPAIDEYLARSGRDFAYSKLVSVSSNKSKLAKREEEFGLRLADLEAEYHSTRKCPECREEMADLGLDFKAPRQTDKKAWAIIQGMYRAGHEWRTCGCDGPGWIPTTPQEYQRYLTSRMTTYENNLMRAQASDAIEEKQASVEYWATRIRAIKQELSATS